VVNVVAVAWWAKVRRAERAGRDSWTRVGSADDGRPIFVWRGLWDRPETPGPEGGLLAGAVALRPASVTWREWRVARRFKRQDRRPRDVDALRAKVTRGLGRHGGITVRPHVLVWRLRNGGYAAYAYIDLEGIARPAVAQMEAARVRARYGLEAVYLRPMPRPMAAAARPSDRRVAMKQPRENRTMHLFRMDDGTPAVLLEMRREGRGAFRESIRKGYLLQDAAATGGIDITVLTTVYQVMNDGPVPSAELDLPGIRERIARDASHTRRIEPGSQCGVTLVPSPEGLLAHLALAPKHLYRDAPMDLAETMARRVAARHPELAGVLVGGAV